MHREQIEQLQCECERFLRGGGADIVNDITREAAEEGQNYQQLMGIFDELPQLVGQCLGQSDVVEKAHSAVSRISDSCHRMTELLSDIHKDIGRIGSMGSMHGFDKSMSSTKPIESIKSTGPTLSTEQTEQIEQIEQAEQAEQADQAEQTVLTAPTTVQCASDQDSDDDDMSNVPSFDLLRSLNALDVDLERYRQTTQSALARIAGLSQDEGEDKGKDEDDEYSHKPLDKIGGSSVLAQIRPSHIPGHYKNLNYVIDEMYGKIEKKKEEDIDDDDTCDGEFGSMKAESYSDKLLDELNRLEQIMDE